MRNQPLFHRSVGFVGTRDADCVVGETTEDIVEPVVVRWRRQEK
jgi:hypothetical protein